MKLIINKKYYFHEKSYQGTYRLIFITRLFQFRWFTDCDEWFLYIHIGKRWWRFSGAGYMKGVS
jgi:hypothetical protein